MSHNYKFYLVPNNLSHDYNVSILSKLFNHFLVVVPITTSQTTTYHFWKVNFGFLWDKSIHFIQTFFKSHFANFFGFNYTLIIPIQYMTINYNVLIFLYGAIAELRKKTNDTSIIFFYYFKTP